MTPCRRHHAAAARLLAGLGVEDDADLAPAWLLILGKIEQLRRQGRYVDLAALQRWAATEAETEEALCSTTTLTTRTAT